MLSTESILVIVIMHAQTKASCAFLAVVIVGFTEPPFTITEVRRTVEVGVGLLFGATNVSFDVIVSTVNDFDAVGQWIT